MRYTCEIMLNPKKSDENHVKCTISDDEHDETADLLQFNPPISRGLQTCLCLGDRGHHSSYGRRPDTTMGMDQHPWFTGKKMGVAKNATEKYWHVLTCIVISLVWSYMMLCHFMFHQFLCCHSILQSDLTAENSIFSGKHCNMEENHRSSSLADFPARLDCL